MQAVKAILEYFGLFDQYPFLYWQIPFAEMAVWEGMARFMGWALVYQILRWFWFTGWFLKLLEKLLGHLWDLVITIFSRMIGGVWDFLARILELLFREMLKYRLTKFLLIGGSLFLLIRLWFALHSFFK